MSSKLIKVCGMREAENIRAVEALGVDWLGFIFWPGSSRYVSERPAYLPEKAKRVGVFVDADVDDVLRHAADYRLDLVQLHGHESADYIRQLRRSVGASLPIIKAISVSSSEDMALCSAYMNVVDYFLFDTKSPGVGGSGRQFDWTVLEAYDGSVPFLLSGGIGPDDAARLNAFRHPLLAGIDLNSRFELRPGFKDTNKLKSFLYEQDQPTLCRLRQ